MKRPWIGGEDLHNFHWTKRISSRKGDEKIGEEGVLGSSSCVIFSWERQEKDDES